MKLKCMIILLIVQSSLYAIEQPMEQSRINQLITAVKNAPIKERRILMNALKTKLKNRHKATRNKVMIELRSAFHQHTTMPVGTHMPTKPHAMHSMSMNESKHMKGRKEGRYKGDKKGSKPKPPKKHGR